MKEIKIVLIVILMGLQINAQEQSESYPTYNERIFISINHDSIAAYGFFAAGKEKKQTILLLHGLPGNDKNLDIAEQLRRDGNNVIYFNYRGSWGSQGEFLFSNCIEDVSKVVDYFSTKEISENYKIDTNSLVLLGHSMGAGIALISGGNDTRIKEIILCSPWNLRTASPNDEKVNGEFMKYLESEFVLNVNSKNFNEDLIKNYDNYNILRFKDQLSTKKILIIDENERNQSWIEQLKNAEYLILESDHSFTDKRGELIENISNWLKN